MSTYRTVVSEDIGRWGVTIVREGTQPPDASGHRPDAQLVAVVVNGDQELAERICTLLNGVTVTPAAEHAFHSAAAAARTMPRHEGYATHDGLCAALRALGFEVPLTIPVDSCTCALNGSEHDCPRHGVVL